MKYLEDIFRSDPTLMKYLPEQVNFEYLTREFLFAILFEAKRSVYESLARISEQKERFKKRGNLAGQTIKVVDKFRMKLINLPDLEEYEMKQDTKFIRKKKRRKNEDSNSNANRMLSNNYRINEILRHSEQMEC